MSEERKNPQRTCIACRKAADKKELLRYALSPGGQVLLDYRQRLPGRGVYTCCSRRCLALAIKKQAFGRGFRKNHRQLDLEDLLRQLKDAIAGKVLSLVGMARKAGMINLGSNAVLTVLKRGQAPALIITAEDISPAIGAKIRHAAEANTVDCVCLFSKSVLGQTLGKHECSAVAFDQGHLAETLKNEIQRFDRLMREN